MAEVISLLTRIEKFGVDNKHFIYKSIQDIEPNIGIVTKPKFICFDTAKSSICKRLGIKEIKSCDMLYIVPKKKHVDFIEIKTIEKFSQYYTEKDVAKQVTKYDFEKKILDSVFLFKNLMLFNEFVAVKNDNSNYQKIIKNYYILVDQKIQSDAVKTLAVTLAFLEASNRNIKDAMLKAIEEKIDLIKEIEIENIKKPILIGTNEFLKKY